MYDRRYPYAVVTPLVNWDDAKLCGNVRIISRHVTLANAVKSDHRMQSGMDQNSWLDQRVWKLNDDCTSFEPLSEDDQWDAERIRDKLTFPHCY